VTAEYSPIADYAIIGDCRSAALISRDGSIDWWCLPRFDSPSVFAAILDRVRGGCFRIAPAEHYTSTRRYVGHTAVLETTFRTASGTLRVTDVMPVADEETKAQSLWPEHELLRLLAVIDGEVEVDVTYQPRLAFATVPPRIHAQPHQSLMVEYGRSVLLLRTELPLRVNDDGSEARGKWRMRAGERVVVALSYAHGSPVVFPAMGDRARELLATSIEWWERWAGQCRYDWHYRDQVLRSALTLKLLTYAPSGAIVAAATTSLPETIGGVRNWDYRYCWLRDASLTLRALLDLGFTIEGESFLSWLLHATRLTQPRLQILYDVYGEAHLPERTVDHLEGYRGSRPVRTGNDATGQLQLDVYGEVIDGAYQFVVRGGRLDRTTGGVLLRLGRTVCDLWKLPDEGIWEPRSGRRQNTHSKVMCWLALDRLIRLQTDGHVHGAVDGFASVRDEIRATVEREAWNAEIGSYVATLGGRDLDASLLRLSLCGYVDARDARMRATTRRVRETLAVDGLMYRYRVDDGLPGDEGAFGICSFWGVECIAREGRLEEATEWFEALLRHANDVGLLAEEIDVHTGELLGNFPQAFTHVGVINAALTLAEVAGTSQAKASTEDNKV
jgi:GH15 family glucan-1,4-alpha-glucosidase